MFERIETAIPGVIVLRPTVHTDGRGFFLESYHARKLREAGITDTFVQDNHSRSQRGTLRGLHYQVTKPQGKLCRVARGAVLDVAVDIRRGSPAFGRSITWLLTDENKEQIYIPSGFAHGFLVLSDEADFLYKCTDYYDRDDEQGILWSDPDLGISWNITAPILSAKDVANPRLREIPAHRLGMPFAG